MSKHTGVVSYVRELTYTAMIGFTLVATPGLCQESTQAGGFVAGLAPEAQLDAHDYSALANADPVDRQLAGYARHVSDMGFLRLYGAGGMSMLRVLPLFLGEGALNVDYEHDEPVRDTLIKAQMQRIEFMLRRGLPSATLFKAGLASQFDHAYLCVITLDAEQFRQDPGRISRLMTPDIGDRSPAGDRVGLVEVEDFLRFTVDHEVFHCLDAYFNGPTIRKTHNTLQHHFQSYANEARADAFASLSFQRNGMQSDDFLKTLAAMRTLSVLDMDMSHFTGDVIRRSIETALPDGFGNIEQLVATSRALASAVVPSADHFALRIASAAHVAERLGGDPRDLLREFAAHPLPYPNDTRVASLFTEIKKARNVLASASAASMHHRPETTIGTEAALLQLDAPPVLQNIGRKTGSQ